MDLPVELLTEIFRQSTLLSPDAPLTLRRTSRTFYHIVHSTPSLWTRLFLDLSLPNGDAACTRKAETWFKRAGAGAVVNVQIVLIPNENRPVSVSVGVFLPSATNPAAQAQWVSSLSLPRLLALHAHQIQSLAVHSCVPAHIQTLLDKVYSINAQQADVFPLKVLQITSCQCVCPERGHNLECGDCSLQPANPRNASNGVTVDLNAQPQVVPFRPTTPSATAPLNLPLTVLPYLEELDVIHHSVPRPFSLDPGVATFPSDLHSASQSPDRPPRLRILRLISPIRFPPVSTQSLFNLLNQTRQTLEHFEFEGRLLDNTTSPSQTPLSEAVDHPSLFTLPRLRTLLLRCNKISVALSHVLTPRLRRLRLDDLDGTRPRASRSSDLAKAMRGLVVRMELPFQQEQDSEDQDGEPSEHPGPIVGSESDDPPIRGLRSIELSNVAFKSVRPNIVPLLPTTATAGSLVDDQLHDETAKIWTWIFRRLRVLEELTTRRVPHASDILKLLMPPPHFDTPDAVDYTGQTLNLDGTSLENLLAVPSLRTLNISTSVSVGEGLGNGFGSHRASNRWEVVKFRKARRGVRVRLGVDGEPDDEFIEPMEAEAPLSMRSK